MNNTIFRRLKPVRLLRYCSYKPIKRPSITNQIKKTTPKLADLETPSSRLFNHIRAKIMMTGPLTVADYMREVLTNPIGGYYMNRDVFGSDGDYITSPEIGQIFGELVAIWCLTEWRKLGSPSPFQIIELGPGRGTLSQDVLKVLKHFNLRSEFSFHLVEISPYLSKIQAQRLCYTHDEVTDEKSPHYYQGETVTGTKVFWYRQIEDIPKGFSIVLAHEFFDALPIHKLQKDEGVWKEILVDVDTKNEKCLRYVLSKSQTPISTIFNPIEGEERECLEYSTKADSIVSLMAERFEEDGGFGLIMDYGHFGEKTDTFRAFKQHKLHDPLFEPGTADLTADVDFKRLKITAEADGKVIAFGPVEQGLFLKRMESDARLKILLENALPENVERIQSGYEMLTDSKQMGARFKFFSIFPAVLKNYLEKFPVSGFS